MPYHNFGVYADVYIHKATAFGSFKSQTNYELWAICHILLYYNPHMVYRSIPLYGAGRRSYEINMLTVVSGKSKAMLYWEPEGPYRSYEAPSDGSHKAVTNRSHKVIGAIRPLLRGAIRP